jgi:hypothetical protein
MKNKYETRIVDRWTNFVVVIDRSVKNFIHMQRVAFNNTIRYIPAPVFKVSLNGARVVRDILRAFPELRIPSEGIDLDFFIDVDTPKAVKGMGHLARDSPAAVDDAGASFEQFVRSYEYPDEIVVRAHEVVPDPPTPNQGTLEVKSTPPPLAPPAPPKTYPFTVVSTKADGTLEMKTGEYAFRKEPPVPQQDQKEQFISLDGSWPQVKLNIIDPPQNNNVEFRYEGISSLLPDAPPPSTPAPAPSQSHAFRILFIYANGLSAAYMADVLLRNNGSAYTHLLAVIKEKYGVDLGPGNKTAVIGFLDDDGAFVHITNDNHCNELIALAKRRRPGFTPLLKLYEDMALVKKTVSSPAPPKSYTFRTIRLNANDTLDPNVGQVTLCNDGTAYKQLRAATNDETAFGIYCSPDTISTIHDEECCKALFTFVETFAPGCVPFIGYFSPLKMDLSAFRDAWRLLEAASPSPPVKVTRFIAHFAGCPSDRFEIEGDVTWTKLNLVFSWTKLNTTMYYFDPGNKSNIRLRSQKDVEDLLALARIYKWPCIQICVSIDGKLIK